MCTSSGDHVEVLQIEIVGITMGVYLTISLLTSAFMNYYNKRMALVER